MRHGWSIRLAGLAPASLIAACLATPATHGLPADRVASSATISAEAAGGGLEHGSTSGSSAGSASAPTGETAAAVDWTADCLTQLRRLEQAGRAGRLTADDRPSIAVVLVSGAQGWLDVRPRQPVDADLPLEVYDGAPPPAVPCVVQIGPARDQTSAHRAIDLQDVASIYQSGVHRERNPEYDVAERTLRQAKRDARGDNEIISVGDPLLDLIGLAVGGVINAFDSRSSSNRIAQATAELASIPRSREQPVYRPYTFERYVLRAQKEAVVPVALLDGAGRSLRSTELRQREMRELFMLRGLDPRDRDYEQHRSSSMTPAEFARWQRTPPALRLSSVAAALVGDDTGAAFAGGAPAVPPVAPVAPSVPPLGPDLYDLPDTPHDLGRDPTHDLDRDLDRPWQTDDPEGLVALSAGLPDDPGYPDPSGLQDPAPDGWPGEQDLTAPSAPARGSETRREGFDLADLKSGNDAHWDAPWDAARDASRADPAASGPHAASVVRIKAGFGPDAGAGSGFYVREDLVLTAYGVVREASVVDVTMADGATVPALVASVDPTQGLALVQVPRPGPALALYQGSEPAVRPSGAVGGAAGLPLLVDDRVVGMTTRAGDRTGVVAIGAIRAFLEARASALPILP